ncbi:serine hydrolase domain-containing protein [Neobacillus pocheonensis]|uniref:serine hydrolase domain-containing protein n=1 Tax=Neobacillus pocheonensis TaxID=363869 RepID=UPI003D29CC3F
MKYKLFLIAMLFSFGLSGCVNSNAPLHHVSAQYTFASREKQIQQKIREYLISNHVNGSVAAVKNNKEIFSEGVGFSDLSKRTLNSPTTTFPIASITKTIVAVCILQLQEKGKLRIDDPVSKYLPDFPKNVKIVHLLNHTSGIQPPIWHPGDRKPKDIIKEASERGSKFSPGTKWDYNDINYMVLGYIVERESGVPLHEYIERNIFKKAAMVHAGFISSEKPSSEGYIKIADRLIQFSKLNRYLLFGCGDIEATAEDLIRFDDALMSGKLISHQSLKELVTAGPKSKYGLGLYSTGDRVYSRGVVGGWESFHVYYKDRTSIVILLNVRDKQCDIKKAAAGIYQIINEKS